MRDIPRQASVAARLAIRAATVLALLSLSPAILPQAVAPDPAVGKPGEPIRGVRWTGEPGIRETVAQIMERERRLPPIAGLKEIEQEPPRLRPFRQRESPDSPAVPAWPPLESVSAVEQILSPQSLGLNFKTIGLSDSGYIPPDSVGDVGKSQIFTMTNGRIRVRSKQSGTLQFGPTVDTFFDSVRAGSGVSDPHVRYDRLSARWFVVGINVTTPNRVVLAVSDGATITDQTSFTFFQFQFDLVGPTPNADTNRFFDYPTFGVDRHALYIGGNVFGGGVNTTTFVVNKADLLAGTLTVTAFRQLVSAGTGPWSPQGVSNDDGTASEGYFIGPDMSTFGRLMLRRVIDPGGIPAMSGNIPLTVPTTSDPVLQTQQGTGTPLDSIDDRLFAAAIHKSKITGMATLWTAHNIQVTSAGVGCGTSCGAGTRNGSRWYEIGNLTTTPTLLQSGTLFDPAASAPRGYWIPSVAVTGQGHMVLGASMASANDFAGAVVAGRMRDDPPGATQAATIAAAGVAPYVLLDGSRNRWGDYSQTCLDPEDDQTVWTFQEYADGTNAWALRAIQLKAPPPATPVAANPASVCQGVPSVEVTITGSSSGGSEFFDPGDDFGGPGFSRRILAGATGGVGVLTTTLVDATHVNLVLQTTGAASGAQNVTIRNPDRQAATGTGILTVDPAPPAVVASSNGPLCEGATLELQASSVPGASYTWAGPNGFSSNLQNPSLPNVTASASGDYTVVYTTGGCASFPAATTVLVNPRPAEVDDGVRLSQTPGITTITWNVTLGANAYDVLRGTLSELPVGPSNGDASEVCLAGGTAATLAEDPLDPPSREGFWYLVRGVNACGGGSYGFEGVNGVAAAARLSATCP